MIPWPYGRQRPRRTEAVVARLGQELVDEPALADAGRAEDRDEDAAFVGDGPLEGGPQDAELAIPSDHRAADASMDRLRRLVHGDEAPDDDRLLATLDLDLRAARPSSTASRTSRQVESPIRVSPGSAACCSRAATLTASPVARLPPARASPTTTAPVLTPTRIAISRPRSRAEGRVQGRQRDLHLGGGADGPERVVLVDDRDAEDRHDRVADELLDRPTVALEDRPHRVEPAAHDRAQRLRVEVLAKSGRAGDVGEHDGDDLARLAGRLGRGERRPARHAEARDIGVGGRAGRADDHPGSLRTVEAHRSVPRRGLARARIPSSTNRPSS